MAPAQHLHQSQCRRRAQALASASAPASAPHDAETAPRDKELQRQVEQHEDVAKITEAAAAAGERKRGRRSVADALPLHAADAPPLPGLGERDANVGAEGCPASATLIWGPKAARQAQATFI